MNACWVKDAVYLRALQNELKGQELADFANHLRTCESCQERLAEEKSLSQLLEKTRPLYRASTSLRSSVESMLREGSTALSGRGGGGHDKAPFSMSKYNGLKVMQPGSGGVHPDCGPGKRKTCLCLKHLRSTLWGK